MTLLTVDITTGTGIESFDIRDYVHDETHRCKLEVFRSGDFIASFQPDRYGHLHICKKTDKITDELLHKIAEQLETYNL